MRLLPIWYFAMASVAWAQPQLASLAEAKKTALQDLAKLPNYTCSETIERFHKDSRAREFELIDRVHIEVGYVGGKEVVGWPGGDGLTEEDVTRAVTGTVTNGDFAFLVRSLFNSTQAAFVEAGQELRSGQLTLRYDYRVPMAGSDWRLGALGREASIGYHGSFWVDNELFDLVELDTTADDVPQALGFKAVERVLQFAPVRIGASDFVLPQRAVLIASKLSGDETKSETSFHDCHQFSVETALRFDLPDAPVQSQAASSAYSTTSEIPEEFEVQLALQTEIDSDRDAVGDPITAILLQNIQGKRETVIPKGAVVHGRIARLELLDGHRCLDLAFTYFDVSGTRIDIRGRKNQLEVKDQRMLTTRFQGDGEGSSLKHGMSITGRDFSTSSSVPGPIRALGDRLRLARGYGLILKSRAILTLR